MWKLKKCYNIFILTNKDTIMFNMQTWSDEFLLQPKLLWGRMFSYVFMQMLMTDENPNFSIDKIKKNFFISYFSYKALNMLVLIWVKLPGATFKIECRYAVMYIFMLFVVKHKQQTWKPSSELFENGFLSAQDEEKLWDAQKGFNCDEKEESICLDSYNF